MRWAERDGVRWLQEDLGDASVAFSARLGGASERPFDSLNLGLLTGDDPDRVFENRRRLAAALGIDPLAVVVGHQVHGSEIAGHDAPQAPTPFAQAGSTPPSVDGHWTAEPDLALLVFVADCLPIALVGEGGVAILHGGWRGLAAGILERGVRAVDGRAAAIGPGIGPCCYEVGGEVLEAFSDLGPGVARGSMLDLVEVSRRLLERAGVERVAVSDLCTRCNPELFFSHRGEGPRTGRQAGLIWRHG